VKKKASCPELISCFECDNFVAGGAYARGDDCAAFLRPGPVPVQGRSYPIGIHEAWMRCKGKKFVPRRPWWKRLLCLS